MSIQCSGRRDTLSLVISVTADMAPPTEVRTFDFRTELTIYFSQKKDTDFAYEQS